MELTRGRGKEEKTDTVTRGRGDAGKRRNNVNTNGTNITNYTNTRQTPLMLGHQGIYDLVIYILIDQTFIRDIRPFVAFVLMRCYADYFFYQGSDPI